MEKKNPINLPPPELIKLDTSYTISINPNPTIYNKHDSLILKIQALRALVLDIFNDTEITYILLPEQSKVGKLHAHGTMKFRLLKSIALFYNNIYNKQHLFTMEVDTLTDEDIWNTYVTKNQHILKPFCKENLIHYTIKSIY